MSENQTIVWWYLAKQQRESTLSNADWIISDMRIFDTGGRRWRRQRGRLEV